MIYWLVTHLTEQETNMETQQHVREEHGLECIQGAFINLNGSPTYLSKPHDYKSLWDN